MSTEAPLIRVYTEQLASPSYPTPTSLGQNHQEGVQASLVTAAPSFPPTRSLHEQPTLPMMNMHNLQLAGSGTASATPFQAPSMLPSPPVAENDVSVIAPNDGFNMESALGASDFDELAEFDYGHWLLEDDFDFTVFEQMGTSSTIHEPQLLHGDDFSRPPRSQLTESRPKISDLRKIWYIQVPDDGLEAGSGTTTPRKAAASLEDIDENYRAKLASTLRPALRDEPLPSIEFLNLCIHLFFTKFNIALPLIHGPSFRASHGNALLVLSICSAGCLSLGSEMAARTGSMLFERVNKAILVAPWERVLPRNVDHTWNVTKASMIGQTYALLSEDPVHRTTAAAYHGSMIALARHHKLFSPGPAFHLNDGLSAVQLDQAWRNWARQEELKRVAVLLYIHDAEIAALFHHEPVFRHNAGYIPTVCSQDLFSAPSAASWASLFRAQQRERQVGTTVSPAEFSEHLWDAQEGLNGHKQSLTSPQRGITCHNMFDAYNALSGISASICECRHLGLLSFTMVSKFESDLLTWYASTPKAFKGTIEHSTQEETPINLLPLWHYCFITLSTDLNILEVAVGREGAEIGPSTREYLSSWVMSSKSKRCLLHALFLQNLMVATNMGALVAIHTPRILFSAALCWYSYMLCHPDGASASGSSFSLPNGSFESLNSLPEIQLLQEDRSMSSARIYPIPHVLEETLGTLPKLLAANSAEMKANTLCVIESILRRLGMGGISLRFADIIQVFISGEIDRTSMDPCAS